MTLDRVEFVIGPYRGNVGSTHYEAVVKAGSESLGIPRDKMEAIMASETTIHCRPSQFARFLIFRDQYGGTNDFKGLKARLGSEEPIPEKIDVSGNRV